MFARRAAATGGCSRRVIVSAGVSDTTSAHSTESTRKNAQHDGTNRRLDEKCVSQRCRERARSAHLEQMEVHNGSMHYGMCGHILASRTRTNVEWARRMVADVLFGDEALESNIVFVGSYRDAWKLVLQAASFDRDGAFRGISQKEFASEATVVVSELDTMEVLQLCHRMLPGVQVGRLSTLTKDTNIADSEQAPRRKKDRRASTREVQREELYKGALSSSRTISDQWLDGNRRCLENAALVSMVPACDVTGHAVFSVNELASVVSELRRRYHQTKVCIDARTLAMRPAVLAQLARSGVDFMMLDSEWFGCPEPIQVLYVQNLSLLRGMTPMLGGEAVEHVSLSQHECAADCRQSLEAWSEPAASRIFALGAALASIRDSEGHARLAHSEKRAMQKAQEFKEKLSAASSQWDGIWTHRVQLLQEPDSANAFLPVVSLALHNMSDDAISNLQNAVRNHNLSVEMCRSRSRRQMWLPRKLVDDDKIRSASVLLRIRVAEDTDHSAFDLLLNCLKNALA
ncbi:hypothetical protein FVE85_3299 [Porphyridium purpureum]|uniref:Aminotransferase class V domain-containing protein n=1 Tax=Porphyridium purpureum TaxID=35688 RepID=A0A5J4YV41_PORPP|nr:hypothetical protein FVE85_3299 [Porphyridium purpureum]|eukprot:POR3234..scf227_4